MIDLEKDKEEDRFALTTQKDGRNGCIRKMKSFCFLSGDEEK